MIYAKCVYCQNLDEQKCSGPGFATQPMREVVEWMVARAKHLGLSHRKIAEKANMALGTIDSILAGRVNNPTWESVRPILTALGCGGLEGHCIDAQEMDRLQKELAEATVARDTIKEATAAESQRKIDYLLAEVKEKKRGIVVRNVIIGLLVALCFWLVLGDARMPDIGMIRY